MTYQNVGTTPRFYVSILQWLKAVGKLEDVSSDAGDLMSGKTPLQLVDINPSHQMTLDLSGTVNDYVFKYKSLVGTYSDIMPNDNNFQMWLGHNFGVSSENDYLGSYLYGTFYDMPVAPDLSLSMEHDYSGIRKTTSMSGASFSNANWSSPPKWGDKEAWQLGDFPRYYSGRRIWDLSFSYVSDSDLEPRNYTGTTEATPPQQGDANWFENVLHYTMGHLPFIFQPNKDATYTTTDADLDGIDDRIDTIPEFAICRFDMDSFTREQVAPGVYNIKIKIKETW